MSRAATLKQGVIWPILLVIVAMISIQIGASIAKGLFPIVGAPGTTALRLFFGAVILMVALRPWRTPPGRDGWRPILLYGAALGCMNFLFYLALRTVPLGIAVALEFTGPLAVAVLGSRRPIDFLWVALAIAGLLLLLPLGQSVSGIDPVGAGYALGAGACWALYIIFGQKAGGYHGTSSVAWGSLVAAALIVPIGVADAGEALLNPAVIPMAIGVAVLSTALPYTLEMTALTRLPARVFGTLMSVEPAIGALSGLVLLGEQLTVLQWAAISAVIVASLGAALTIEQEEPAPAVD